MMNTRNFFRGLTILFGVLFTVRAAPSAQAANFSVGTEAGLTWAINVANREPEADTITFWADITLTKALPRITSEITIEGAGFTLARHSNAASDFSVLYVTSTGDLTVNQITLSGGSGSPCSTYSIWICGGGIYHMGVLH